jgi:hypothetical protein
VDRDVILLGRRRQGEGVPLEVRDLRHVDEDVLASPRRRLLLLDLDLDDVGRVLDDFGDVGAVAGANLAQNTFTDPDDTADNPVALCLDVRSPKHIYMVSNTYPEDTDRVEGAVRRAIRLDHAEHAVQLPVDEEHDEQVMRVPEHLEAGAAALLHGVPDHDAEDSGHDPAGDTRASGEIRSKERDNFLTDRLGVGVDHRELGEVDHVRGDVHERTGNDRPCRGLVEGDVLVKRNDVVEGGAAQDGDEVAADGKEDEDDIDVENECGRTGNA